MTTRPVTTLFMLESVDGKISTGSDNDRDFDKDLPSIPAVAEGLSQYYKLEEQTDLCSLNSGRVMVKVGWNEQKASIDKLPVSFVIIDSKPHLTELGVRNLIARTKKLYIVTTNADHPAKNISDVNLKVLEYENQIDWDDMFNVLIRDDIKRVTIQSGSQLNAHLLRSGYIDNISIVIAPILVGGSETPSLIGGGSIQTINQLDLIRSLTLNEVKVLDDSYLHLTYSVNELKR